MTRPTPTATDGDVALYRGEALEVLTRFDKLEAGAVFVDAPYSSGGAFRSDRAQDVASKYRGFAPRRDGTGTDAPKGDVGAFAGDSRDGRSFGFWLSLVLGQLWRAVPPGAFLFVFTDWRQLPTMTDAVQAGGWTWRGLGVWDKGIGRPVKGRFRNHLEYVIWATHGRIDHVADVYPSPIFRHTPPTAKRRYHVTQKPVDLYTDLLEMAPPGPVVDPFLGSGSAMVAARRAGRPGVGIEVAQEYVDLTLTRLTVEGLRK